MTHLRMRGSCRDTRSAIVGEFWDSDFDIIEESFLAGGVGEH